jgi:hypothetical protein
VAIEVEVHGDDARGWLMNVYIVPNHLSMKSLVGIKWIVGKKIYWRVKGLQVDMVCIINTYINEKVF